VQQACVGYCYGTYVHLVSNIVYLLRNLLIVAK